MKDEKIQDLEEKVIQFVFLVSFCLLASHKMPQLSGESPNIIYLQLRELMLHLEDTETVEQIPVVNEIEDDTHLQGIGSSSTTMQREEKKVSNQKGG